MHLFVKLRGRLPNLLSITVEWSLERQTEVIIVFITFVIAVVQYLAEVL